MVKTSLRLPGQHGGHRLDRARIIGLALCLAFASTWGLVACGASTGPASAHSALFSALDKLDQARSVHLAYSTTGHPPAGETLATGGYGDLERPGSFTGTFEVSDAGLPVSVSIVVVNGTAYLQLPFSPFREADLSKYGFPNPVTLFDPRTGLSAAFRQTSRLSYTGTVDETGVTVWSIAGYVPDAAVSAALDMSRFPVLVKVIYYINPPTGRLMSVSMTGPFYKGRPKTVVTITLSKYGERVPIRPPD